ncbi:MAG: 2-iminoacetate synthase ThiH [Muribaculaceae bacterium]|nr:2-iminoacetate synthase ThiH [Muribaculaceae bacterium]
MKSDPSPDAIFGHGFADLIDSFDWDSIVAKVYDATTHQVDEVLDKAKTSSSLLSPEDLGILISPAATSRLEDLAALAKSITDMRFGKTISLYIPMYVGNACTNKCVYCGFNHDNDFSRKILSFDEIREECEAIKDLGSFQNLLLVAGEYPSLCGIDYMEKVLEICRPYFHNLTLEVQPMKAIHYKRLAENGLNGVVCFQETYHKQAYPRYHPRGMKSHFDWRLNGFDRMGEAGLHKIGMGALLGLEDWHGEAVMMGHHLRYLQKKYWRSRFSINFPRLRPSESGFKPNFIVSDADIVQLCCAFRIFDNDIDISFSTRENSYFRNAIIGLGATSMSAGSRTEPGGYSHPDNALEQFEISDNRSPQEVAMAIQEKGYDAVWKDWDMIFD